MRFIYLILSVLLFSSNNLFSQQITVDDTIGVKQLIEDNLVDGCVEITNIISSVNGVDFGLPSYASFKRADSNFPFENGIMLSTGSAASGGNSVITEILSETRPNWGSDLDLEFEQGTTNGYVNATAIEFDFVSISNQFQFNYLLASEEYFEGNTCDYSDGFVFLIKEANTANPYRNIAIIPETTTPVNTSNIRPYFSDQCLAQNEQYFDGKNLGDTNYDGRTAVLTASGSILPNVMYHIKLIIADQTDGKYDSAVFIEGDSFRVLELGEDVATCAGSVLLDADIQNSLASYNWYLNGNPIGTGSPTLNAIKDGTYRVEVSVPLNGINCVEEDEINIDLNAEEPINPITDFEKCDDSSGDGIEIFDLTTKNPELETEIENIPFTNYEYSYHLSDADARNDDNRQTTITSSSRTIFVRVQDRDTDCQSFTTFDLIVNSLPVIVSPTPLLVCDGDDTPDGLTIIDLTLKDDEITDGNTDLSVSYHYTPDDSNTGERPISDGLYINNPSPDEVYVRIVDTTTLCATTTTLDVIVTISPVVNRDTQYLNACDNEDLDGNAIFDLTEVIDSILNGLANVSTTFHISYDDAVSGENPVADETNYEYTNAILEPGSATLYLRIVDEDTECATIVPFEIHTNLLLTGTDTGDYAACDNDDDDTNKFDFNLFAVQSQIANNLDVVNGLPNPINVTFYESEEDRANGISINKLDPFSSLSPQVLWITIDDGGCIEETEITLLIDPVLLFNNVTILYCDDDDDGIANIDLESLDDEITGGNTNFTVSYFDNPGDAEENSKELPRFFTNTSKDEIITLYARITSIGVKKCYTVNEFQIEVRTAPTTAQPDPIIICDNSDGNPDGFVIVNLNAKISEIVTSTTGLDIDFFTSPDDADTKSNEIPETERDSYNTNTQTIYVRVEDITSNPQCHAIVSFEVIINTEPVFPVITNFQICEPSGVSKADFLLIEKDAEILNGQPGKEVYYFKDPDLTIPIDKTSTYTNTDSTEIIYVLVENISDPSCYGTSSFKLQVSPDPIYNPIKNDPICDDITNDGKNTYNLDEIAAQIREGLTGDDLNISFHETFEEADIGDSEGLVSTYTNEVTTESIFIRIESDDSFCHVVEPFFINIVAAPDITNVSSPITNCDTDYDGITTFDLTTADFQILDSRQGNLIVNYFENFDDINQDDGLDNTNEILNPQNFISNSKTVYIKVANTLTTCYSVIPLELIVNLPPVTNSVGTIEICDNDTDTYDLSQVDTMIVGDPSLVTISYHDTPSDAEANEPPLNTIYNYTANSHNIYVRISDVTTGCHIVSSFILQINQNPIAITPPDLVACDDDYDGIQNFDLTTNNSTILGGLDPSIHSITYFGDLGNAENKLEALPNMYSAVNADTIYVRLEINSSGCFDITQFNIRINPLPIISINEIVPLCNDQPIVVSADTGVAGDAYLWSTGAKTAEIIIPPTSLGLYFVTVTRPNLIGNDCSYTHNFNVIPSDEAVINFTPTVNFADPNRITVEIDTSRIGDYVFILDGGEPQSSNIFEDVSFGEHSVTVRDLNGCMDVSKEVFVFDIPKFVTPNNDNAYDTWHIVGANQLPGTVVYIYNRHGKLIKTLPYLSNGWDGTYNGQNMPSDDYWFSADIVQNGESFNIRGHFALKR